MKKTLIALAAIAAVSAAQAEVTLYGVIDIGISTTSNQLSSDANNPANSNFYPSTKQTGTTGRQTGFTNGGLTPSRWGVKGSENLGDGLKANFVLEGRIQPAAGTNPNDHALLATKSSDSNYGAGDSAINGGIFDSQSTLGLSGGFGSIDFGYQLNLQGQVSGSFDPFGGGYVSPLGTYGGLSGGGSSYTGRTSNAIKYQTTMGSTQVKAFYVIGGNTGNSGQGTQLGLALQQAVTPTANIAFVAQKFNDNVSFGAASSSSSNVVNSGSQVPLLSAVFYNSTTASLMGDFQATSTLKLMAGYQSIVQSNPSNATADATSTSQVLGIPVDSVAYYGTNVNKYVTNATTTVTWLGGIYDLSNVSRVRFGYYQRVLGAYTANTKTSADSFLYAKNNQNIFAAMYDYDLSKTTDVYAYGILNQYDSAGGSTSSTTAPQSQWSGLAGLNINQFGVGMRMKF